MPYVLTSSFTDYYSNNAFSINEIVLPASCIDLIN